MKQIIRRIAALVIGLGLGATALAGLESVTHISDLNSAWPLGSDLASTSDDHIRNIKVALKTDFPNVNAAVTPTPAQFNQLTSNTFTNAITVSGAGSSIKGALTVVVPASGATVNLGAVDNASTVIVNDASATNGYSALTLENAGVVRGQIGLGSGVQTGAALGDLSVVSSTGTFRIGNGTSTFLAIPSAGAIQGLGPVAAALVDMTPDTGTFTITYTGFTAGVTGTAQWSRIGKLVILNLPSATGTSNAATMTATGLPAAITPATNSPYIAASSIAFQNGGSAGNPGTIDMQVNTAGTITFFLSGGASNWTSSATSKGLSHATQIAYLLN